MPPRSSSSIVAFLAATSLSAAACNDAVSSEHDASFVAASDTTRSEIGVTRWSTATPGRIEGYDAANEIVVVLEHAFETTAAGAVHRFGLREHERVAKTQFIVTKNARDVDTFKLLEASSSDPPALARALERMKADLEASTAARSTSSLATAATSALRPTDLTEGSSELVCGKDILLADSAELCLNHRSDSPEDQLWQIKCHEAAVRVTPSGKVEPYPGEGQEGISCWEPGDAAFNECICIDKSTTTWQQGEGSCLRLGVPLWRHAIVECSYKGTGNFEKNECGKDCEVQEPYCYNEVFFTRHDCNE